MLLFLCLVGFFKMNWCCKEGKGWCTVVKEVDTNTVDERNVALRAVIGKDANRISFLNFILFISSLAKRTTLHKFFHWATIFVEINRAWNFYNVNTRWVNDKFAYNEIWKLTACDGVARKYNDILLQHHPTRQSVVKDNIDLTPELIIC